MTSVFSHHSVLRMCRGPPDLENGIYNTQNLQIQEDLESANTIRKVGTGHKTEVHIFSLIFF